MTIEELPLDSLFRLRLAWCSFFEDTFCLSFGLDNLHTLTIWSVRKFDWQSKGEIGTGCQRLRFLNRAPHFLLISGSGLCASILGLNLASKHSLDNMFALVVLITHAVFVQILHLLGPAIRSFVAVLKDFQFSIHFLILNHFAYEIRPLTLAVDGTQKFLHREGF